MLSYEHDKPAMQIALSTTDVEKMSYLAASIKGHLYIHFIL